MLNDLNKLDYRHSFSDEEQARIMQEIAAEANFRAEKEVYREQAWDPKRVKAVTFTGKLDAGSRFERSADLKVQFIKPEVEEAEIIRASQALGVGRRKIDDPQDGISEIKSEVGLPQIYLSKTWEEKTSYGYLATPPYSQWPPLFAPGLGTKEVRQKFVDFYGQYHYYYCTQAWLPVDQEAKTAEQWVMDRVKKRWYAGCVKKGRLDPADYEGYYERFNSRLIVRLYLSGLPLVWGNRHLTGWDIRLNPQPKVDTPKYVITKNLFWSYLPQWYDLVFPIWHNLTQYPLGWSTEYAKADISAWLKSFEENTLTKFSAGVRSKKTFFLLLAERMLGAILADDGMDARFDAPEKAAELKYYLNLHQEVFDWAMKNFVSL